MLLLCLLGIFALIINIWLYTSYMWAPQFIKYDMYLFYILLIVFGFFRWKIFLIFLLPLAPFVILINSHAAYDWGTKAVSSMLDHEIFDVYALSLLEALSCLLDVLIMITAVVTAYFWWSERDSVSAKRYFR